MAKRHAGGGRGGGSRDYGTASRAAAVLAGVDEAGYVVCEMRPVKGKQSFQRLTYNAHQLHVQSLGKHEQK